MSGVLDSLRSGAKNETSSPATDSNSVSNNLARYMKIKPCRVCRSECFQISSEELANWKQNPPTHSIQNSMYLYRRQVRSLNPVRALLSKIKKKGVNSNCLLAINWFAKSKYCLKVFNYSYICNL